MNKQELKNLPRLHGQINTCIDDNLEMICVGLNRLYSLSFYDLWDFKYNKREDKISQRIYLFDEVNKKNIKKYNGIVLEDKQFQKWEDTLKEIVKNLDLDNPVMIHMYRRLFPWDMYYNMSNVPDFFTHKAMAIDIDSKTILVTDGYCNKFNEYIEIEKCKQMANNKLTIMKIIDIKDIDLKQYFKEFKKNQINKKDIFKNIEKFAKDVTEENFIKELEEAQGSLYKYSHMYNSITKIIRSRKKIKRLLKEIGIKLNNEKIVNLSNDFDQTIMNWEYVNSLFVKYTLTFRIEDLQKSEKYLLKIKQIEEELLNKLERIEV